MACVRRSNMKKQILKLLLLPSFLASCSNNGVGGYAEAGFRYLRSGEHVFAPKIVVAVRAERTQRISKARFAIYPGTINGFEEEWENYHDNPHSGSFCIRLRVFELGRVIEETLFKLEGFPNEERYLLTYESPNDGSVDFWVASFKNHLDLSVDFSPFVERKSLQLG